MPSSFNKTCLPSVHLLVVHPEVPSQSSSPSPDQGLDTRAEPPRPPTTPETMSLSNRPYRERPRLPNPVFSPYVDLLAPPVSSILGPNSCLTPLNDNNNFPKDFACCQKANSKSELSQLLFISIRQRELIRVLASLVYLLIYNLLGMCT